MNVALVCVVLAVTALNAQDAEEANISIEDGEGKNTLIRKVCDFFDRKTKGTITSENISGILSTLGNLVTDSDIKAMIKKFDSDGDGILGLSEALELTYKFMFEMFNLFDSDNDGKIKVSEMKEILVTLDLKSNDQENKIIDQLDVEKTGAIDIEDIKKMIGDVQGSA